VSVSGSGVLQMFNSVTCSLHLWQLCTCKSVPHSWSCFICCFGEMESSMVHCWLFSLLDFDSK